MKKEDKKAVAPKAGKDNSNAKPKKKVTANSIDNVIKSATGKTRANSAGSHLDDGTWVSYKEEK